MKYYLVSDDADTCTGLRLAGVFFMLATNKKLAEEALNNALEDDDVGLIMITENIKKFCPELISKIEKEQRPVLIEIPDSKNAGNPSDSLGDYIRATVGISI